MNNSFDFLLASPVTDDVFFSSNLTLEAPSGYVHVS